MTKLSKKVLSILCVIALLVSCIAVAFAEEADEAPVWDETQQLEAEAEAARIAAEEAETARIAAEEAEAARKAAEEEAARIAAEEEDARIAAEEAEAARIAAEEAEAARKAAEEEAARKAAEEAEAARKAAEEEAARKAAEEEAARKAAEEEAARKAAEEEAARKAAEEEAARKAAEEEAARKAAEEEAAWKAAEEAEAARKAAEEEAARKAAEEEAARKAAEEEAARKAAEEEAARKAAEEEAARKAAEEEAARKAAEEEAAGKAAEEEEAQQSTKEQVPQEAAAAESSNNEVLTNDAADANGNYEVIEGWGYVDPDVISEKTPEMTDEFKGLRSASMSVNEMLSDTLSFGDELMITLKCGNIGTVDLKLYSTGTVNVKIDDKPVAFAPADSDDAGYAMSTYMLENTTGRTYHITLSAKDTVAIKLAAVAEQTEVQDVTPGTEEAAPIEGKNEESTPSEDINGTSTDNDETTDNTEITDNTETTENTDNDETTETNENTENGETNIESIGATDDDQNDNSNITIEPVEPAEPTIQVSMKTYNALKVGNSISDTLIGGQKAKIQVKCGKNLNVKLVLTSNPDDINVSIDGTDAVFTQEADGTYAIELNNVAFRKFSILLSAKQDLEFTLSAESAGEATEAEGEEEEDEDENKAENKEENAEDINKEETEPADENTEEKPEVKTEEKTDEVTGETEENENKEEADKTEETDNTEESENTGETEKTAEKTAENTETSEGEEVEGVEDNIEENEKMTALGCTKVTVTVEEGADLYAEASKESEVVGHLDAGTEIWITLNEDQTFGQLYSEDEEAAAQYISMDDAAVKAEEVAEEETKEETEEQTEEEKMNASGCTKVTVTAEAGANLYAEASKESEVVGHLDAGTEICVILNEDKTFGQLYSEDEETAAQYISMDDAAVKAEEVVEEETKEETEEQTEEEKMTALGYTKVTVTAEAGADLYAEASKESEVVGHLDAGTEIWVTLNEDQTFGQLYSEDEEVSARFISMEDTVEKTEENKENKEEHEIPVHSTLDDRSVEFGSTCTLTADASEYEGIGELAIRWYYTDDGYATWKEVEGANELTYQYTMGSGNWFYRWKACAVVTVQTEVQPEAGEAGEATEAGPEGTTETAAEETAEPVSEAGAAE